MYRKPKKDVIALNATTGKLEKKILIFSHSGIHSRYDLGGAQLSPNGQDLYLADTGRDAIASVNTVKGRQIGTRVQVGRQPLGIAVSPIGTLS
jgi:DNA-binding beta-propeller fold protein YncE